MQRRILIPAVLAMARIQVSSAQALDSFIGLANSAAAEISAANAAASTAAASSSSAAVASSSAAAGAAASSTSSAPAAASSGAAAVGSTGYTASQLLAIIICSIIFGLLAILLIILALYCCLRSRRRRRNRENTVTTDETAYAPAREKRGLFGGLFKRQHRRSATPVREKHGFRGPTDSDPLRENAPLTSSRHNDLAMTETAAAAPMMETTARPITAEHPAFRNQQNHDNPFTPEPPPTRKAVGSNGHHALRDAAVVGAAYGGLRHEETHRGVAGTFRGPTDGAGSARSSSSFANGRSPSRNHPAREEALVGGASTYPTHRYSNSGDNTFLQDRPSSSHHGVRDATLVGGALAAEGVHHHHRHHSRNRPASELRDEALPIAGSGAYGSMPRQNTFDSDEGFFHGTGRTGGTALRPNLDERSSEHHGFRDAALVGGGLAAAEGVHHEHRVHDENTRSARHSDHFGTRDEPLEDERNVPLATGGRYNRLYQNVHSNESYEHRKDESSAPIISAAETTGASGFGHRNQGLVDTEFLPSEVYRPSNTDHDTIRGDRNLQGETTMTSTLHGRENDAAFEPDHLASRQIPTNARGVDVGAGDTGLPTEEIHHTSDFPASDATSSSQYPRALDDAAFAGTAYAISHDGPSNRNALSANQRRQPENTAALGSGFVTESLEQSRSPLGRHQLSSETNISRYSHGPSESPFSAETSRTTPGYDEQREYGTMPLGTEDAALLGTGIEGRRYQATRLSSPFSDANAVVDQPVRGIAEGPSSTTRGYTPKHAGRDAAMIGGAQAAPDAESTLDDRGSYSLSSNSSGGLNSHPVRRNRPPTPFGLSSTDSSSGQPIGLSGMLGQPMDAAVFNPSATHQSQEVLLDSGSATSSADHPYSGLGRPPTSSQLDALTHEYPSAELRHSLASRPESFHAPLHESVDRPHEIEPQMHQRSMIEPDYALASNTPGAFPITPANEDQPPPFAAGPNDREVRHMRQPSLPHLDERNLRPKLSPLNTNKKSATPPLVPSRSPNRRSFGFRDAALDSRRGSATPSVSASGSGSGDSWRTSITGQGDGSARGSIASMPQRPWGTPRSGSPYGRASGIGLASTTDLAGPYNGIDEGYGHRTEIVGGVGRNERAETGALGRRMRSSDLSDAERERRFGSFGSMR